MTDTSFATQDVSANGDESVADRRSRQMSEEHKIALAAGRVQGKAVRQYLEALSLGAGSRGRPRTTESIDRQLAALEAKFATADATSRLTLIQDRLDLEQARAELATTVDLSALEDGFVAVAASYSQRKGISYAAWRESGVPAAVLKRAGIASK